MDVFSDLIRDIVSKSKSSVVIEQKQESVVEFVESSWGLNYRLFPGQRFILKLFYDEPLDNTEKTIPIPDPFTGQVKEWYSEQGYLDHLFSSKRTNIKNTGGGKRNILVLPIGRRGTKCLRPETLIYTDHGILPIGSFGDLSGPEVQPLNITVVKQNRNTAKTSNFYNPGILKTIDVKTHCGYVLGGSESHRVKVLYPDGKIDWKCFQDLQVGDRVGVHRGPDLWGPGVDLTPHHPIWRSDNIRSSVPQYLDEDWGLLLGYLVGDGTWTRKSWLQITTSGQMIGSAAALCYKLFGRCTVKAYTDRNCSDIRVHSKPIREFLNRLGYTWNSKPNTKHVPWVIMQSPKAIVAAFLRGLFEADGYCSGRKVGFTSASWQLAHEVQMLLLNFGVISRLYVGNRYKGKDYYTVKLMGRRSRRIFADEIGFATPCKDDGLSINVNYHQDSNGSIEAVPFQKIWLQRWRDSIPSSHELAGIPSGTTTNKLGWEKSKLRKILGNSLKASSTENVSYTKLHKAVSEGWLDKCRDLEVRAHFEHLLESDLYWDTITETSHSEAHLCDIEVPDGHDYSAGGFINHNSEIAALCAVYETWKLLQKNDPQKYYGLPPGEFIEIIVVATEKEQAATIFARAAARFEGNPYFKPYIVSQTLTFMKFRTQADIDKRGPRARASIKVSFRACNAKSLRGKGYIVVILDELAFWEAEGGSSPDKVWTAVTPATKTFAPKDPEDARIPIGPSDGRIICISSPMNKAGKLYELYEDGMKGDPDTLVVQTPTWEVNPTIPPKEYISERHKMGPAFWCEWGGEFSTRVKGWIEREADLVDCIKDPSRKPTHRGAVRVPHYLGLDLGLSAFQDGTGIAVSHVDGDIIVLDEVIEITAGLGRYEHRERLDVEEDIYPIIADLCDRFMVVSGLFDQFNGYLLEQFLHQKKLKQLKVEHITQELRSKMYQRFKLFMYDKKIDLLNFPLQDSLDGQPQKFCKYINELLELEAERKSYSIVQVGHPKLAGKHDDMSDAIMRSVWLASDHVGTSSISAPRIIANSGNHHSTLAAHKRKLAFGPRNPRMVPLSRFGR